MIWQIILCQLYSKGWLIDMVVVGGVTFLVNKNCMGILPFCCLGHHVIKI